MLEWSDLDYRDRWVNIRHKVTHDGVEYRPKDKDGPPAAARREARIRCAGASHRAHGRERLRRATQHSGSTPVVCRAHVQSTSSRDVGAGAEIEPIKLFLHNFRHYFVSECADRGVPMPTVMDWVGHADMENG